MKITLSTSWKFGTTHPPLGLAYIASVLRENGYNDINVIDYNFVKDINEYKNLIKKSNPDVLGISIMSPCVNEANELAKVAKQVNPNIVVIGGGPHPTIEPISVLKNENFNAVTIAEAEYTFLDLIKAVDKNKGLKGIKGLYYKEGKRIIKNQPRGFIENLDELPYPARDLLEMDKYLKKIPQFPMIYPETNLIAMRGCPFNCSYCQPTGRKLFGAKVRYRTPKNLVDEMQYLQNKYHLGSIFPTGDTLTANKKWTNEFCNEIIKRKLKINWILGTRVDTVNKEMINLMAKSGCYLAIFGVESGSPRILNEIMNKGANVEQVKKAFKWCREVGIATMSNFMIGSPTETKEDVEMSLSLMKEILPDWVAVYITNPLPGTKLYDYAKENNLLVNEESFNIYDRHATGTMKRNLSDEELKYYERKFVDEFLKLRAMYVINPKLMRKKFYLMKILMKRLWSFRKDKKTQIMKEAFSKARKLVKYSMKAFLK